MGQARIETNYNLITTCGKSEAHPGKVQLGAKPKSSQKNGAIHDYCKRLQSPTLKSHLSIPTHPVSGAEFASVDAALTLPH